MTIDWIHETLGVIRDDISRRLKDDQRNALLSGIERQLRCTMMDLVRYEQIREAHKERLRQEAEANPIPASEIPF